MVIIRKKQDSRFFNGKKFKRHTSYGKTLLWNKMAVESFKVSNKKQYYIRAIERKEDGYEIYLRKK